MQEASRLTIAADLLTVDAPLLPDREPCRRCKQPTELSGWQARGTPFADVLCARCLGIREQARRAKREAEAVELLMASGVLPEHARAKLDDFPAEIANEVHGLIGSTGMLLNGSYGRGKTRLAAAIAREHAIGGETVLFGMARTFLRRIRDTYGPAATETESAVLRKLCQVDLLVIDDLGPDREGKHSEYVLGTLHEVLSDRIGNCRSTVVTTNLPAAAIEQHYGGAIASRMRMLHTITLGGPDRRIRT